MANNPIQIYYSGVTTNVPVLGIGTTQNNIGLNGPDKKLFYFDGTTTQSFDLTTTNGNLVGAFNERIYTDPADFTAGTTTTLPLNITPANESVISIQFNGVGQGSNQWSFVGTVLTFASAIPIGVTEITIKIFEGTPSTALLAGNNLSDLTNAATARTNLAITSTVQGYTAQQNFLQTTLTDAINISWDLNSNQSSIVTLAGNRILNNPINMVAGGTYLLIIKQDATGSRTLTYGTSYKFPGGTVPTLTTTANAVDIITFVSDGTLMRGVANLDFK